MLEHPSISEYQSVKISDCGQSAGNPDLVGSPQRLDAKPPCGGEKI